MGKSIDILNNIRANASEEYQNRIPEATQENIAAVGNALQTYTMLYNEFCAALVNKIGKSIIEQKLFENKLARFKSGALTTAQDVEEIFIEMAKAEGSYDKDGSNPLGRRNPPDVKTLYHRLNRQDYYAVSIGDIDFIRVFRSEATLDAFIAGLINSVYSGANYDEWLAMKNLLATYNGYVTSSMYCMCRDVDGHLIPSIGAEQFAKDFVKLTRKLVNDLSFASKDYNGAGVMTWTKPEDLVMLVNKDVVAEVDVEVLSKAFNMGKTDFQTEIIVMDDFGSLGVIPDALEGEDQEDFIPAAVLVDKDWFRVWDTLSHMEPQRNAQGLFTNYFYHVHQILSASRFKNAVLITMRDENQNPNV